MQSYKLLALKLSILLPTPCQWWVLQIVIVTQGISLVSVYNPHPNPSASLLQSRETALLTTATIQTNDTGTQCVVVKVTPEQVVSKETWLGQGCGIGCGEGPILTTLNLRIRIRRDLRDHLIQALNFVKESNEARKSMRSKSFQMKWSLGLSGYSGQASGLESATLDFQNNQLFRPLTQKTIFPGVHRLNPF